MRIMSNDAYVGVMGRNGGVIKSRIGTATGNGERGTENGSHLYRGARRVLELLLGLQAINLNF
jgi:hypothetical protein